MLKRVGQRLGCRAVVLDPRQWYERLAVEPPRTDMYRANVQQAQTALRRERAPWDNGSMTSISLELLVGAAHSFERMTFKQREGLVDEIHTRQPNLLYSVIVQKRFGATFAQLEVVINMLFVFYLAMKDSGRNWPVITEDVQERCLTRLAGRMRFIEGLTPQQKTQSVSDVVRDHPEQPMLAYVFDQLMEHNLLVIETDAQHYLMLAALNLVECIAQTAPEPTSDEVAL